MNRRPVRLFAVLLSLSATSCFDFQPDPPMSPSELPGARYVDVRVQYRQPNGCANVAANCDQLVVFFGSWMKAGEEIYLEETGSYQWAGVARHVPVNWPPSEEPHLVRVFDPHLYDTPNGGVTAARLAIGGQIVTVYDQPGTPAESGLVYIDDNGVGRNPQ